MESVAVATPTPVAEQPAGEPALSAPPETTDTVVSDEPAPAEDPPDSQ
jgi:hypothetical protein